MNQSQSRVLIGMMLAAYPREAMNQETVGVWTRLIETFDYDETRKAVLRILATRYTFPTIADLRNEIIEARLELPSAERAYEMWLAYADRGGKLMVHPFVRQVANDAGFDLWTMRQSENPSILRSQFLKAYEERRRLSREIHDGIAQDLAVLAFRWGWLLRSHGIVEHLPVLRKLEIPVIATIRDSQNNVVTATMTVLSTTPIPLTVIPATWGIVLLNGTP